MMAQFFASTIKEDSSPVKMFFLRGTSLGDLGDQAPEAQRNDVYLTLELLESGSVQTAILLSAFRLNCFFADFQ
jgi:hypothetical protein